MSDVRQALRLISSDYGRQGRVRMRCSVLAFLLGVVLLQRQAALFPSWALVAIFGLMLSVLLGAWHWCRRYADKRWLTQAALFLLMLAIGFTYANFRAERRLQEALALESEGEPVVIEGWVDALPERLTDGLQFPFQVAQRLSPGAPLPERILLNWAARGEALLAPPWDLAAGERWQFAIRLIRPHSTANPYTLDREARWLGDGIRAIGTVDALPAPVRLQTRVSDWRDWPERWRGSLRARVEAMLPADTDASGQRAVIAALLMGDQRLISQDRWLLYNRTGVGHLFSISGLHITMFGAIAAWIALRLLRYRVTNPRRWAALAAVCAAGGYALVAGWQIPAQRTVWMLVGAALAQWLRREPPASGLLAMGLWAVLLVDPWAVLDAGFWLSFGAVAVLLWASAGSLPYPQHGDAVAVVDAAQAQRVPSVQHDTWRGYARRLWGNVHRELLALAQAQWVVTLGLTPLALIIFGQVSLVAPLANALAIPLVGMVAVPLILVGVALPVPWLLQCAAWVLAWVEAFLKLLVTLPNAALALPAPAPWAIAAAILGVALLLSPKALRLRLVGASLILPLFLQSPESPPMGAMRVAVLDVGQGLAVAVQTAHHQLLFDAGPKYRTGGSAGETIVVPWLRGSGWSALDVLMVSHADADHYGGAAAVLQTVPAKQVFSSAVSEAIGLGKHPVLPCVAGQTWGWDGVVFSVLHPAVQMQDRKAKNNSSCVLMIQAGEHRVLLTGDIEAPAEAELLTRGLGPVTVMVVPHHGSASSSTPDFVLQTHPHWAVFTPGWRNNFGHPRPEVVQRWRDVGARTLRTDESGEIEFLLVPGAPVHEKAWRDVRRRYWMVF